MGQLTGVGPPPIGVGQPLPTGAPQLTGVGPLGTGEGQPLPTNVGVGGFPPPGSTPIGMVQASPTSRMITINKPMRNFILFFLLGKSIRMCRNSPKGRGSLATAPV